VTPKYARDDDDVDYMGGYNQTVDENDDVEKRNVYSESNDNKQQRMRPTYYGIIIYFLFVKPFLE
jgi:hypothetical protein